MQFSWEITDDYLVFFNPRSTVLEFQIEGKWKKKLNLRGYCGVCAWYLWKNTDSDFRSI